MSTSTQIRNMTAADWSAVSRIYQEGLDTGIATFETQVPTYEVWDEKHHPFCRYVVHKDDVILGWLALSPVSHRHVYRGVAEVSLYVSAAARGQGVGKMLFQKLIPESEKMGLWTLQSGIFAQNKASIGLHLKMGFREIGLRRRVAKRDGIWHDNMLMERRSELDF